MKTLPLALLLAALPALLSCRKPDEKPHRTEPWLAHPSASASSEGGRAARRFRFSPGSRVRFSILGKKAKLSGAAPVTAGFLELAPRDLTRSSASVTVDLLGLTLDDIDVPSELELGSAAPRALALEWLELGPEVPAEKREQYRLARFELSSIEGWSGAPLDFSGRRRVSVRLAAVGTLLLHGFRAPVRADLTLTPQPGEPAGPGQLSIRSAAPLVLPLAPHEIAARGPGGVVDAARTAQAADWLGKNVRLEVELMATSDDS